MNSVRCAEEASALVEQAVLLDGNDMAIRDEKDAVLGWHAEVLKARALTQRESLAAEASAAAEVSLWSYVRSAVAEVMG